MSYGDKFAIGVFVACVVAYFAAFAVPALIAGIRARNLKIGPDAR